MAAKLEVHRIRTGTTAFFMHYARREPMEPVSLIPLVWQTKKINTKNMIAKNPTIYHLQLLEQPTSISTKLKIKGSDVNKI